MRLLLGSEPVEHPATNCQQIAGVGRAPMPIRRTLLGREVNER